MHKPPEILHSVVLYLLPSFRSAEIYEKVTLILLCRIPFPFYFSLLSLPFPPAPLPFVPLRSAEQILSPSGEIFPCGNIIPKA